MKKPATKIAFLFGLYIALHFMSACVPNCDCPAVNFPFFDYQRVSVTANDPAAKDILHLDVLPEDISFLATVEPK